jgi:DNA-binding IclR family transcriptional regulator
MSNECREYSSDTVSSRDLFKKDRQMIQSVDRSVRILLALQAARRLSLSDLAARLDLPNSTVHGILRTLAAHGMVEQEPGSLRYMLGPGGSTLSSVYLDSLDFRSRALKWAEELSRRTGASVRAGVPPTRRTSSSCITSRAPTEAGRCPKSDLSSPGARQRAR